MLKLNRTDSTADLFSQIGNQEFTIYETLHLLKNTIPTSFASVISLSFIIFYVSHPYTHPYFLPSWISCLFVTFAIRFCVSRAFLKRPESGGATLRVWLKRFQLSTLLTGVVWASGVSLILYTADGLGYEHYVFMTFVITGFFVGAMLALCIDKFTMLMSCVPSLVPLYWCFFEMADDTAYASAAAFSLFLLYIYFTARRHGRSLHDSLRLRFNAVEEEKRLKQILDNSPVATSISDLETDVNLFVNQAYQNIIAQYANQNSVLASIMVRHDFQSLLKTLHREQHISNKLIALQQHKADAPPKWVLASFSLFDFHGRPAILSWFYDITDRKRMEDEIQHLAYHDPLTGLPNRSLFDDRLKKAMKQAKRNQKNLVLMFIDLDGFKPINDSLGHDVGDSLLRLVADRMVTALREADTVARLGGDEFAALAEVNDSSQVYDIAEKIRKGIESEFVIDDNTINISCSIGISNYPEQADSSEKLLVQADQAMYKAKQQGRNQVVFFSAS
jgi:diguanylate cyclase (GGDEF)-like protein